jgi:hypothetical protein
VGEYVRNYIYSYTSSIRDTCLCMFVFLYFHSNINKTYYSIQCSTEKLQHYSAASMPLTRCPKNALHCGVDTEIAQSLCSRVRLADWPWTSQCFGCSPQHQGPCSHRRNTTGSSLILPCWGPLDERWPRALAWCGHPWFPYSFLLLLLWQAVPSNTGASSSKKVTPCQVWLA